MNLTNFKWEELLGNNGFAHAWNMFFGIIFFGAGMTILKSSFEDPVMQLIALMASLVALDVFLCQFFKGFSWYIDYLCNAWQEIKKKHEIGDSK